jgi:hypothetical protein
MMRKMISCLLMGTILLAQGGLPLHMHYCKGMLESISVFFTAGCEDHREVADLPTCCQKATNDSCSLKNSNCCDDEVTVLLQDFDSLIPHFDKWDPSSSLAITNKILLNYNFDYSFQRIPDHATSSNGPPIYILFHSLKLDV